MWPKHFTQPESNDEEMPKKRNDKWGQDNDAVKQKQSKINLVDSGHWRVTGGKCISQSSVYYFILIWLFTCIYHSVLVKTTL